MSLSLGTRLGPYEVTAQIGAGGMGEVYRARDTRLDRTVAIKVLPIEVAGDTDLRSRFEREARAVAALDHPHICGIYDVGSVDGTHYLVMPHLDGQTLAARLEKGPLPLDQALKIATEIADALDKAHRHGITHRDLKPANIMLTKAGSKLLDFGLAKLKTPTGPISMSGMTRLGTAAPETAHGTVLGTVLYMAPEQVEGKDADARSDIWALGAVIFETITGMRPFKGDTPASIIGAILRDDAPSISRVQPFAPPLLDHIVTRCLAKDPDDRWQSARDLSHALAMVNNFPVGEKAPIRRRTLAVASLIGFLTALAIGMPLWTIWPRLQAEPRSLSFHLTPPADNEFLWSPNTGGSVISPDGQSVAFVAVAKGTPRLWIRALNSLTARELPDTDEARFPFWSPDSSAIGFSTSSALRRIDVSGAGAVTLARALDSRGGTWNADGTIVFSPNSIGPLYQVSASGGTPAPLTTLSAGESTHRWPKFLPDGRTLLYFVQGGPEPGVYLTRLDRPGDTKRLLNAGSDATYVPGQRNGPGYLLWVARDTVMAQRFDPQSAQLVGSVVVVPGTGGVASAASTSRASVSTSNDGTLLYNSGGTRYQLQWFGRDGTPGGMLGALDQYIGLRLSPNGLDALVTIRDSDGDGDLWRVDLASGARSRVTCAGGWYGIWSQDSQRVAFTALNRRTVMQVSNARGGCEVQNLTTSELQMYPSDWSHDGKYLAFATNSPETSNDVWLLSMTGAPTPEPILKSAFSELHAQFSPDGRWLTFTSNETGRNDVYVQSFPDKAIRRIVSSAGGAYPRWGPRGGELFYQAPDGNLMTIPIRLAGSSVELGTPSVVLRRMNAVGVHPYPYDVAADGRILALTPASGAVQDLTLTVLMNWQAALEP